MILGLLLIAAQPTVTAPIDPAAMNPAQRRVAAAIGRWMTCLAPQVADRTFPTASAADAASAAAMAACRRDGEGLRGALVAGLGRPRGEALYANVVGQFREQVRQGTIRRQAPGAN